MIEDGEVVGSVLYVCPAPRSGNELLSSTIGCAVRVHYEAQVHVQPSPRSVYGGTEVRIQEGCRCRSVMHHGSIVSSAACRLPR